MLHARRGKEGTPTKGQPLRVVHNPTLDLRVQFRHTLIVKRHLAADQDIQDDAEAPDIDLWTSVLPCLEQFWCGEVETATECLQVILGREQIAETKVNDLDIARLADEDILDLEVSMYDAIPVAVIERTCHLTSELPRLLVLQASMRDDVVQHLSTVDVFEQHVPMIVCPLDVSHCADVGMVEQRDDGGLSSCPNLLRVVLPFTITIVCMTVVECVTGHNFDGNLLASLQLLRQLHLPHAPGPYRLSEGPDTAGTFDCRSFPKIRTAAGRSSIASHAGQPRWLQRRRPVCRH